MENFKNEKLNDTTEFPQIHSYMAIKSESLSQENQAWLDFEWEDEDYSLMASKVESLN